MQYNGVYILEDFVDGNFLLAVEYTFYWEDGDRDLPPSAEIEIDKAYLNDMDITEFYWDYLEERMDAEVTQHAHENYNN